MDVTNTFLYVLEAEGILAEDEAVIRLEENGNDPFALLKSLLEEGAAPKHVLGRLWGDSINVAYVDMDNILFQSAVVSKLPKKTALEKCVIPLYQFGEVVTVASIDPYDEEMLARMEEYMGHSVNALFAFPEDIKDAIAVQYQDKLRIDRYAEKISRTHLITNIKKLPPEKLKKIVRDKAVIGFANAVLLLGVKERATAIHVELEKDTANVRFRVDGVLRNRFTMDITLYNTFGAWLKHDGDSEFRYFNQPRTGRIIKGLKGRTIEFKWSYAPTSRGEKIVVNIRSQKHSADIPDFQALGFSKSTVTEFESLIEKPGGLFIVAGPSGAGKAASIFAALKHVNSEEINIMTVEDAVEYRLPGINQVSAGGTSGLDYLKTLRVVMEQDPDVLLISRIDGPETAKLAVDAALTGCLVLGTMQTDNSPRVLSTLTEMGIDSFLVSASVVGVMAQRKTRRICEFCKESHPMSMDEARKYFIFKGSPKIRLYRGAGCDECGHTGYSGEIPIHEVFSLNDEIRTLVSKEVPLYVLENAIFNSGFKPMRYDGLKKALRGLTTIDELNRVIGADE